MMRRLVQNFTGICSFWCNLFERVVLCGPAGTPAEPQRTNLSKRLHQKEHIPVKFCTKRRIMGSVHYGCMMPSIVASVWAIVGMVLSETQTFGFADKVRELLAN